MKSTSTPGSLAYIDAVRCLVDSMADGRREVDDSDDYYRRVDNRQEVEPMMSASYRLSGRTAERLARHADPATVEMNVEVVAHTTDGLKMIDGSSLRVRWPKKLPHRYRGLYGCNLTVNQKSGVVDRTKVVAVGLCCVDETLDKCELMVFPLYTDATGAPCIWRVPDTATYAGNSRRVCVLSEDEQASLFPVGTVFNLRLVVKTSEFSTIAHNAWLHDHIQRNITVLDRWSSNKQVPLAVRHNLAGALHNPALIATVLISPLLTGVALHTLKVTARSSL